MTPKKLAEMMATAIVTEIPERERRDVLVTLMAVESMDFPISEAMENVKEHLEPETREYTKLAQTALAVKMWLKNEFGYKDGEDVDREFDVNDITKYLKENCQSDVVDMFEHIVETYKDAERPE